MSPGEWREHMGRLDKSLIDLLNQRARATVEMMQAVEQCDADEAVAMEDDECLARASRENAGPLPERTVRAVFRELLSGVRELKRGVRVCYLGPEFSYSHLAAVRRFGTSAELVPVASIASVFDALDRSQADFGLVPIENSTDGRVTDTLDMFARLPVRICGEVQLRIHHCLLGKCGRAEITKVCSKPQALSQCRAWLARHLPQAELVETASTAAAARLAAENPGVAAIASRQAGIHHGLSFIAENIEDNRNNITRFAVIGDAPVAPTGHDKTSLMFELPHQPGTLADAMAIFKQNQLNLTWIESFPMRATPSEYLFFVEFQGHPADAQVQTALAELAQMTVRHEILGCYPATSPVD